MTELDATTFDVADMFSGRAYPKSTVDFYTDRDSAFALDRVNKAITSALLNKDEAAQSRLQGEAKDLAKKIAGSKYVLHLTGVSRDNLRAIEKKVDEKYPVDYDFLGRVKPNNERVEEGENLLWALHIEKIVAPNGAVLIAPTPEQIKIIRDNGSDGEIQKVVQAISEFTDGTKSGFETAAMDADFL